MEKHVEKINAMIDKNYLKKVHVRIVKIIKELIKSRVKNVYPMCVQTDKCCY